MDSVTATNGSGMADLIQLLSSSGSPLLSSGLSSSQIQSTLQNASPSDIVQLSDEALQLQVTEGLFAASSSPSSGATLSSTLSTLTAAPDSTASDPSASSVATQFSNYQSQLQAEEVQALFGTGSKTGMPRTSLNVFA
jgi:hypothetical protein